MKTTSKAQRKAVDKYRAGKDIYSVTLPAGTRERMERVGMDAEARKSAILAELERREAEAGAE